MLREKGIKIFTSELLNMLASPVLPIIMLLGPVSMHSCCMSTKSIQEKKNRGISSLYKDPWSRYWVSLNHPKTKDSPHDF